MVPTIRVRSGWGHVLRVRLAETAEPARGFHALLKCCEAAIRAAATHSTAVNRAPRIVLSFGRSVEHSCCSNNAERKQNQSHQSPHIRGLLTSLTLKISAGRNLDLSQTRRFPPPFRARKMVISRQTFPHSGKTPRFGNASPFAAITRVVGDGEHQICPEKSHSRAKSPRCFRAATWEVESSY